MQFDCTARRRCDAAVWSEILLLQTPYQLIMSAYDVGNTVKIKVAKRKKVYRNIIYMV